MVEDRQKYHQDKDLHKFLELKGHTIAFYSNLKFRSGFWDASYPTGDPHNAISYAFGWADTLEGFSFWEELDEAYIEYALYRKTHGDATWFLEESL